MVIVVRAFAWLQKIGKCMMLPVSVLPSPASCSASEARILVAAGSVSQRDGARRERDLRATCRCIFAIGVAIGLTGNDGVAALGWDGRYAVYARGDGRLRQLARHRDQDDHGHPVDRDGRVRRDHRRASIAAVAFNRFYRLRLPSYLGFFAGKRAVPIITAFAVDRRRRRAEPRLAADRKRDRRTSRTGRCTAGRRWRSRSTASSSAR